jgi:hypothetical protein
MEMTSFRLPTQVCAAMGNGIGPYPAAPAGTRRPRSRNASALRCLIGAHEEVCAGTCEERLPLVVEVQAQFADLRCVRCSTILPGPMTSQTDTRRCRPFAWHSLDGLVARFGSFPNPSALAILPGPPGRLLRV